MGAIPVFYVPLSNEPTGNEAIGATLLKNTVQLVHLLEKLRRLRELTADDGDPDEYVSVTDTRGTLLLGPPLTIGVLDELLNFIELGSIDIANLQGSLTALAAHFYPTENLSYTDELAYYRQREWRIVWPVAVDGVPTTEAASEDDIQFLRQLDPAFFGIEIAFGSAKRPREQLCQFLRSFSHEPIYRTVRRIIAPASALPHAKRLIDNRSLVIEMVALEDL